MDLVDNDFEEIRVKCGLELGDANVSSLGGSVMVVNGSGTAYQFTQSGRQLRFCAISQIINNKQLRSIGLPFEVLYRELTPAEIAEDQKDPVTKNFDGYVVTTRTELYDADKAEQGASGLFTHEDKTIMQTRDVVTRWAFALTALETLKRMPEAPSSIKTAQLPTYSIIAKI